MSLSNQRLPCYHNPQTNKDSSLVLGRDLKSSVLSTCGFQHINPCSSQCPLMILRDWALSTGFTAPLLSWVCPSICQPCTEREFFLGLSSQLKHSDHCYQLNRKKIKSSYRIYMQKPILTGDRRQEYCSEVRVALV